MGEDSRIFLGKYKDKKRMVERIEHKNRGRRKENRKSNGKTDLPALRDIKIKRMIIKKNE